MKKKIFWITADCFIDVDLPIIARLKESFDIYWQIIESGLSKDNESYVNQLMPTDGNSIIIEYTKQKFRSRDFRTILWYIKVLQKARKFAPDVYYISNGQMPYGMMLYKVMLPIAKVVYPCHNVSTPKGASSATFTEKYKNWILATMNNIQVFSLSQKKILESKCNNKNILLAYLALKDYGEPTRKSSPDRPDIIRFLNFGIIQKYKRADILIKAGNILYERGERNFKIRIAGNCKSWDEEYAPLIKYPEVFEIDIRRIPNEEVADLFADSQYFVMPYQDIAQSGAITVAFRYSLPAIVSDIPQFEEFVIDGETGITFKSEDAVSLADKMQYLIRNHQEIYPVYIKNQKNFVNKEFSIDVIVSKYRDYLNKI